LGREEEFPGTLKKDSGSADDLEILEVVGIEDEPERDAQGPAEVDADAEAEEFLLGFDDDDEPPAAAPRRRPVVAPVDGDREDRDALLRLRADYDNLRKRVERERQEFELHANAVLVSKLLPVLDNLERAMAVESSGNTHDAMREGLAMIHRQLTDELHREGLRAIESVGQTFDPNLHDAVATDPSSSAPANTIIEEFQRGYLFQDRVLRHAMVRVSTNQSGDPEPRDGEVSA